MKNDLEVIVRTLNGSGELPYGVRINAKGEISVLDVMLNACFTEDNGSLTSSARSNALTYCKRLLSEHGELNTNCVNYKFPGRGQQETPVAGKQTFVAQVLLSKTHNMPVTSFAAVSDRFSVCFSNFWVSPDFLRISYTHDFSVDRRSKRTYAVLYAVDLRLCRRRLYVDARPS